MGTPKHAALEQTPVTIIDRPKSAPVPKAKNAKPPKSRVKTPPEKFTYALKDYTAERRKNGWWISRTWTVSAGEKPQWIGPFATIETACLAIARRLAIELADRHTQSIEWHRIKYDDPLYGLKPTTRLKAKSKREGANDDC
jgi:hypothetical protein